MFTIMFLSYNYLLNLGCCRNNLLVALYFMMEMGASIWENSYKNSILMAQSPNWTSQLIEFRCFTYCNCYFWSFKEFCCPMDLLYFSVSLLEDCNIMLQFYIWLLGNFESWLVVDNQFGCFYSLSISPFWCFECFNCVF